MNIPLHFIYYIWVYFEMKNIIFFKKLFIDSQFFVSLMGVLLVNFFMIERQNFHWTTFFLIFITYWCGYLYTKYQNSIFFRHIFVSNIIGAIVCISFIFTNHDTYTFYKWLLITILGLLYNSSFLDTYIRKMPFLKVFYVGLIWGLINGWLVFREFQTSIFFIIFFYITALVLPFDIRDMDNDEILTFPKIIGTIATKILAIIILITAVVIGYFNLSGSFFSSFFISSIISILLIIFTKKTFPDWYFSVIIETCCGLPFIIYQIL